MTATLTDRYVYAVARSLPEARRSDVERELRATIADDIDARVDAGAGAAVAERQALESLGDPAALVAGYLDRPLHLIGPAYYLTWVRLLRLLLVIVLPLAAAGLIVGQVLTGTPPGGIVGSTIGTVLSLAVHLAFWTALVFWMIERTEQRTKIRAWSLDSLPTPPVQGAPSFAGAITIAAFVALAIAAIIGQQFISNFTDAAGQPVPLLRPELWTWALPLLIVILIAEVGHAFWLAAAGRWTIPHVVVNLVLAAASAALMIVLITGPGFYNPEWFARMAEVVPSGNTPVIDIVNLVTVLTVVGVGVWDTIDGAWSWFRGRRSA